MPDLTSTVRTPHHAVDGTRRVRSNVAESTEAKWQGVKARNESECDRRQIGSNTLTSDLSRNDLEPLRGLFAAATLANNPDGKIAPGVIDGPSAMLHRRLARLMLSFGNEDPHLDGEPPEELQRIARRTTFNSLRARATVLRDVAAHQDRDGGRLGQLMELRPGAGDSHPEGRTVALIRQTKGEVFYKPHSPRNDTAFAKFTKRLFAGCQSPSLPVTHPCDAGDHEWAPKIASETSFSSPGHVPEFYRKAGILVAVLYVLGASDMHKGNVIVTHRGPIVIDGETLLDPMLYSEIGDISGRLKGLGLSPCSLIETRHRETMDASGSEDMSIPGYSDVQVSVFRQRRLTRSTARSSRRALPIFVIPPALPTHDKLQP